MRASAFIAGSALGWILTGREGHTGFRENALRSAQ
jgi:hypothetical protein